MNKFGKKVYLTVHKPSGEVVLDAYNLRVDFDIFRRPGYAVAKIQIYNLSQSSIKAISSKGSRVSISTQLHDGPKELICKSFDVSNSFTELKLPESITNLFCVDRGYKELTSKSTEYKLTRPSLRRSIDSLLRLSPESYTVDFGDSFPEGAIDKIPDTPVVKLVGSVKANLNILKKQHHFDWYTYNRVLSINYKPTAKQIEKKSVNLSTPIVLDTSNLRSTPVMGLTMANISSNLDGRFRPGVRVDVSKLKTARVGAADAGGEDQILQWNKGLVASTIGHTYSYSIMSVQHHGSSHTNEWHSDLVCYSPARGTAMPIYGKSWMGA